MRIYLAGPIDGCAEDWRYSVLQAVDGVPPTLTVPGHGKDHRPVDWPQGPNRWVLGAHEYVGPYTAGCCLGYPQEYFRAVDRADLVFAWIGQSAIHRAEDTEGRVVGTVDDAFVTDVVLGYARARGKYVFTVTYGEERVEANWRSWWLSCQLADADAHVAHEHEPGCQSTTIDFEGLLCRAIRSAERACPRPSPVRDLREVRESFAHIVKWTSDPRVRQEARSMLQRLAVKA